MGRVIKLKIFHYSRDEEHYDLMSVCMLFGRMLAASHRDSYGLVHTPLMSCTLSICSTFSLFLSVQTSFVRTGCFIQVLGYELTNSTINDIRRVLMANAICAIACECVLPLEDNISGVPEQ